MMYSNLIFTHASSNYQSMHIIYFKVFACSIAEMSSLQVKGIAEVNKLRKQIPLTHKICLPGWAVVLLLDVGKYLFEPDLFDLLRILYEASVGLETRCT